MAEQQVRLAREMQLFLSFPFNLGFCLKNVSREEQRPLLSRVAAELRKHSPRYAWEIEPYPDLPGTLVEGGTMISGLLSQGRDSRAAIVEAVQRAGKGITLCGPVVERAVYFAHGIGSVNFHIPLRLEKLEDLAELPQLGSEIIYNLRTRKDGIALVGDWNEFRAAARRSFEHADALFDMWGILLLEQEGRGFVLCTPQSFILYADPAGELEVDAADLPRVLAPCTGLEAAENANLLPLSPGIVYLSEGWDGQVAVLSDRGREPWLTFAWQFAINYWAVLSDLDTFLYDLTRGLMREKRQSVISAKRMMEAIQRIELSVSVLSHESVPTNIWNWREHILVHQGIYDSWETDKLKESITGKLEYLRGHWDNLNALVGNRAQDRMNVVMTTFTFLTFAGVLADVISSVDFNGTTLGTRPRLFVILFGTLSCLLFSGLIGLMAHLRSSEAK